MNNLAEMLANGREGPEISNRLCFGISVQRRQGVSVRSITWAGMQNRRAAS